MKHLIWSFALLFASISAEAASLRVYAAASLTEVLSQVARAYKSKEPIIFNFDASSKLAHQINASAPADLFFSADTDWMEFLIKNDRVVTATRHDLLTNRIVLIVPATAKKVPSSVNDLLGKDVERVALAGDAVPAGKFGRSALKQQGLDPAKIKNKTVSADNVKVALKWVSMGEAQAGIVYQTDAQVDPKVKVALVFPEDSHPKIIYPAAVLKQSQQQAEAQKFIEFCKSDEAKAIFIKAGFTPL